MMFPIGASPSSHGPPVSTPELRDQPRTVVYIS